MYRITERLGKRYGYSLYRISTGEVVAALEGSIHYRAESLEALLAILQHGAMAQASATRELGSWNGK